jgi:hypothetical protein
VRSAVGSAQETAALDTGSAKLDLPSHLHDDFMLVRFRASFPVAKPCGDDDLQFSICRFPPKTLPGRYAVSIPHNAA